MTYPEFNELSSVTLSLYEEEGDTYTYGIAWQSDVQLSKPVVEIISTFRQLDMGDPVGFYDAIITAGQALRKGQTGTLGELAPKPHPWLYAETARVGLGIPFERRHKVIGIEDSSAGVVSIKLAGFSCVGISGGNIAQSGVEELCDYKINKLSEILDIII